MWLLTFSSSVADLRASIVLVVRMSRKLFARPLRSSSIDYAVAGFHFNRRHTHFESLTSLHKRFDLTMTFPFNPLDHPDAEVSRAYFCQLTGRSKITAYRHERIDPNWPRPVIRGGRVFYKAIDCKRYLTSVRAQDVTS
jgi:hypothetical protein